MGRLRKSSADKHCEVIKKSLDCYLIKGMAIGHTPQFLLDAEEGISGICDVRDEKIGRSYVVRMGNQILANHGVARLVDRHQALELRAAAVSPGRDTDLHLLQCVDQCVDQ